jgi:surface antigen
MQQIYRASCLVAVLALAGCSTGGTNVSNIGPTLAQPNPALQAAPLTPAPSQQIAAAQSLTDVTAFLDPAAVALLSPKEKSEAASAQFNALQFGRTGAPRSWQGDRGANGQVLVGPPVNVNSLYCRDFTHSVTAGGQSYSKKGMACRELDGSWGVVSAS